MSDSTRIILSGDPVILEGIASGTPSPGMLLELTNATADTYKVHANAGQPASALFCNVDTLQGNDKTHAHTAAEQMLVIAARKGDLINARIANGENATKGCLLESNGDGYLRVYAADSAGAVEYPASIIGIATEAVDMSGSSAVDPDGFCAVRIV